MTSISATTSSDNTARFCVLPSPAAWMGPGRLDPWFDPALLAPANTCPPVSYDVDEVRRTLGDTGLRNPVIQLPENVVQLWRPDNVAYKDFGPASQRCIEAELALDADALTYASASPTPRYGRQPNDGAGASAQVVLSRSNWVNAVSSQGLALAVALSAGSAFPAHVGHLGPDEAISCVIESSYAFAARAIRAGVDPLIARTWAGSIVVGHGLPNVVFSLSHNERVDHNDNLFPPRTLLSDYYLQALDDVRLGDANRFMLLAARSAAQLRWS